MPLSDRIRKLRKSKDLTGEQLAKRVGTSASYISRVENNWVKSPSDGTLQRIATALEVSLAVLKDEYRVIEAVGSPSAITVDILLEQKCISDFANSAIANLRRARAIYVERFEASNQCRHVNAAMRELTSFDWAETFLKRYGDDRPVVGAIDKDAIDKLAHFVRQRRRPLRIGCGILPGPIATVRAIQSDIAARHPDSPILSLDMTHASGVELVAAAARDTRRDAFDFLIAATGAANLTLVGTNNCRDYYPLFPVHYEKQVCLYRPSTKARRSGCSQLLVYSASSGLEEANLRRHEFGFREVVEHELFTTLVELLAKLDDGQAVNVWDPLSVYLERRFHWCRGIAKPYSSQICLYQHKALSDDVSNAFKALFLQHWIRLSQRPREALGYLLNDDALKHQFAIGSGMTVKIS